MCERLSEEASGAETSSDRDLGNASDEELVELVRSGDGRAAETLFRRYERPMYRLARRLLGSQIDAEDALQEALFSAWRSIKTFRGQSAFSSWLYRIVTNRCLNHLRATQPQAVAVGPDGIDVPEAQYEQPDAVATLAEQQLALDEVIGSLPPEQRVCWLLREGEGLSYAEIAQITELSENAVRGQLYRARSTIARKMGHWR